MKFTINIQELIARPIARKDQSFKWMSKLTAEEAKAFDKELEVHLLAKGVPYSFPVWNAEVTSAVIDREVLYDLLLKANKEARKKW